MKSHLSVFLWWGTKAEPVLEAGTWLITRAGGQEGSTYLGQELKCVWPEETGRTRVMGMHEAQPLKNSPPKIQEDLTDQEAGRATRRQPKHDKQQERAFHQG